MSASSPTSSPPRRPLHERSSSQNNKLGIRIVPYSPPRLSTDGSTTSRVVSCADADAPSPRPSRSRLSSVGNPPGSDQPAPERDDVSALRRSTGPVSPNLSPVREQNTGGRTSGLPSRRSKNVITVNADKTFSLLPHSNSISSRSESAKSPLSSLTTPRSSYGRYSSDTWAEERPSSPLTPLAERSLSPDSSPAPAPAPDSSPWNYNLVGGLRKVHGTPDSKSTAKQSLPHSPSRSSSKSSLQALPVLVPPKDTLSNKQSFQSSQSESTNSDTANYKVLGQSSPITRSADAQYSSDVEQELLPPFSSQANYEIHHASSIDSLSLNEPARPPTGDSDANYLVHRGSLSSLISHRSRVRQEYSRESLVVPPLQPRRRSLEFINLVKSRSIDSLRSGSLTSLSTAIGQEATRALFAGPVSIQVPPRLYRQSSKGSLGGGSSSKAPQMISFPHQWSSQLSTVASESEPGSEPPSRSVSALSSSERRSSGAPSSHGRRRILSVSSMALSGLEEAESQPSHSRSGSLELPQATYQRHLSRDLYSPLVRDHDEDGDGLADLGALHHRSSRTRLNGTLSARSSDRNLRSSCSSRANSVSSPGVFPVWARLYYGSGERRLLAMQSSDSMFSQFNDSRPASGFIHKAPSQERLGTSFHNPRRRPRDFQAYGSADDDMPDRSMDISPNSIVNMARSLKKQTSSIWSPHLYRDKRANQYSIWQPPTPTHWEDEHGSLGRRNIQFAAFVVGFIFPLAWMVAAVLPLPANPQLKNFEEGQSTSHVELELESSLPTQRVLEIRYRRIQWWRSINRRMSIVGFLVIGAVIALSVVGTRQQW
jgi:hypothetical protein